MKRKDLYNYIREEIITELTTVTRNTQTSEVPDIAKSENVPPTTVSKAIQKAKATGKDVDIAESELEEGRKAGAYVVGDKAKFAEAKDLYGSGLYAIILKAIEEAGENGLTQKELGIKLGLDDSKISGLNSPLNKLKVIGVLGGGKLAAAPKPEKPGKEEPEEPEMEEPIDDFETPEEEAPEEEAPEEEAPEEEAPEEKPVISKAEAALEKDIESLAQLKKKAKDIMDKYRDESGKITNLEKYKQEIGNIPQQIKTLQTKIDKLSE